MRCKLTPEGRGRSVSVIAALAVAVVALSGSTPAAGADQPPVGAPMQAMSFWNTYFREPLGMADLTWNDLLQQAAQNHANYWADNKQWTAHTETPNTPGFTGVDPESRCLAVGAPACGEVAYGSLGLIDAASGWMGTPYHGGAIIEAAQIGCGSVLLYGSDCDLVGTPTLDTSDASAAANADDSPVRIWPYSGATGIPTSWTGGEIPDPLASYTGNKSNVGPTLFVYSAGGGQLMLQDQDGTRIPLISPGGTDATTPYELSAGWNTPLAGQELKLGRTYTATVATPDGINRAVSFTAALANRTNLNFPVSSLTAAVSSTAPDVQVIAEDLQNGTNTRLPLKDVGGKLTVTVPLALAAAKNPPQICAISGGYPSPYEYASLCTGPTSDALPSAKMIKYQWGSSPRGATITLTNVSSPVAGKWVNVTLTAYGVCKHYRRCGPHWTRHFHARLHDHEAFAIPLGRKSTGVLFTAVLPTFVVQGVTFRHVKVTSGTVYEEG